jgi:cytochrome P450
LLINLMFGSMNDMILSGDHHRKRRKLLNPLFNGNRMRSMIPIFHEVTRQVRPRAHICGTVVKQALRQLRENIESMVSSGPQEIDIADWMGKLALELIGQAGIGYSFGTLEGRSDQFCHALKELVCVRRFFRRDRLDLPSALLRLLLRCRVTFFLIFSGHSTQKF